MFARLLILFFLLSATGACTHVPVQTTASKPDTSEGNEKRVEIKFEGMVGKEPFACGKSYEGIGVTKSKIIPSDFRFYVSDVALLNKKGETIPLMLDQDGIWQYKSVALLDFENGTGPCINGNVGIHQAVTGTVPVGDYTGIRFTIGIPFELNHNDPAIAPSPLNLTAMFWVWQAGYKFVKIDMETSGQRQYPLGKEPPPAPGAPKKVGKASGFPVHIGSTMCASATKTTAPTSCKNPNRIEVKFDDFDTNRDTVVADIAAVLANADVDVNAPDTSAGCMSAPNDSDCNAVMPAFGLPFNGRPAHTQLFVGKGKK